MTPFLIFKSLHIIAMVTWFAGLFYLPRLFVYHAMPENVPSFQLFSVMEKRLFGIMTIGGVSTLVFGVCLLILEPGLMHGGWLQIKLLLVFALIIYHSYCYHLMQQLIAEKNQRSHRWFRVFNEAPAIVLIGTVVLAVIKPL